MSAETSVVTGAFSYTGKYITRLLLEKGHEVRTLTGHPDRPSPFGDRVRAFPFDFDRPEALRGCLRGAATLYNTYWVRFDYGDNTHERAVRNTETLFRAAAEAGVRRVVHVSIANPSEESPFPYYRGKARLEKALAASGLSHAIIRPTVIFGPEDVLINNIAWCLRRFPFFGVPGNGRYRMQPIFVEEMALLAVEAGSSSENETFDAVGPEIFTFDEWLRLIARTLGVEARLLHLPPRLAWLLARVVGWMVGDVILTWDEVGGLMADLLVSKEPPRGTTRLSEWLERNAAVGGTVYASELARHYRR